jgi:hypothetical protein
MFAIEGQKEEVALQPIEKAWLRGVDLNHRPLGYEFPGKKQRIESKGTSGAGKYL